MSCNLAGGGGATWWVSVFGLAQKCLASGTLV